MIVSIPVSAQAFERFGFWMSQNPSASQEQQEEKLAEIKANPIKGYVSDYDQKMEEFRLRHEKFFFDTTIPSLKKRLKKDKIDKKTSKDLMRIFEEAINAGGKAHWQEVMEATSSLSNAERLVKMTKSAKQAERNRENAKKMVDDLYAETVKKINDLPSASSFIRPTANDDISDAEITPPKAEAATEAAVKAAVEAAIKASAETAPAADASSSTGNNKSHKKS